MAMGPKIPEKPYKCGVCQMEFRSPVARKLHQEEAHYKCENPDCRKLTNVRVGCHQCGRLVCLACLAALPDEDQEERGDICENCF